MAKNFIVANWKMNQSLSEIRDFFSKINSDQANLPCEAWVAPQFIHIPLALELIGPGKKIKVGAQNCSHEDKGAYTGDVSAKALAELGASFVIIGHSERRSLFKENDALLLKKTQKALAAGLKVIFCVGESEQEREEGKAFDVVGKQLDLGLLEVIPQNSAQILLAYEPVWAIGTGKTASPQQAQEMHAFIRETLNKYLSLSSKGVESEIPLLYGGSVKPSNIRELLEMKDIEGALVGGASLKAEDFLELCKNA